MFCTTCDRQRPIVARGLCNACYQRWRTRGTTEFADKRVRNTCNVGDCNDPVVSHGLCDKHRNRLRKHGHVEETRPDDWGAKHKHPLFNSWAYIKKHRARHPVVDVWISDFLQFVTDVGVRPSPKHKLFSADTSKPLGPDNFVWKRAITERVEGEDEKTYYKRAQKVYRAARKEAFQGYELKRRFGISQERYVEMHDHQRGVCAICSRPETAVIRGKPITLAVDHCHSGGHVRELLCTACNKALGGFDDNIERMEAAIAYLRKHKVD